VIGNNGDSSVIQKARRFASDKERKMRYALAVTAMVFGTAAYSQDFTSSGYCDPWCTLPYARDCNYHTLAMCLDASRGTTQGCYQNPFLGQCRRPVAAERPYRRRR